MASHCNISFVSDKFISFPAKMFTEVVEFLCENDHVEGNKIKRNDEIFQEDNYSSSLPLPKIENNDENIIEVQNNKEEIQNEEIKEPLNVSGEPYQSFVEVKEEISSEDAAKMIAERHAAAEKAKEKKETKIIKKIEN